MLGERPGTPRGRYDPDSVYEAASVPKDSFVYGPLPDATGLHIPRQGLVTYARPSLASVLRFVRQTHGYIARDEAADIIEDTVSGLLEANVPNGRITIFRDSYKDWVPDNSAPRLAIAAIRKLFGADGDASVIRDDGNYEHGTEVRRARIGTVDFLLVEQSEIVTVQRGRQEIRRALDAAKVSCTADARQVIGELSLMEDVRLSIMLKRWQASARERTHVRQQADRFTVRHDDDLWQSLLRARYPQMRVGERAFRALRGMVGSSIGHLLPRMGGETDLEVEDN